LNKFDYLFFTEPEILGYSDFWVSHMFCFQTEDQSISFAEQHFSHFSLFSTELKRFFFEYRKFDFESGAIFDLFNPLNCKHCLGSESPSKNFSFPFLGRLSRFFFGGKEAYCFSFAIREESRFKKAQFFLSSAELLRCGLSRYSDFNDLWTGSGTFKTKEYVGELVHFEVDVYNKVVDQPIHTETEFSSVLDISSNSLKLRDLFPSFSTFSFRFCTNKGCDAFGKHSDFPCVCSSQDLRLLMLEILDSIRGEISSLI